MARKSGAQSAEDQIKDQVFSELLALIEESEKMLTYIGGHPWQTVAASATCGLLLGLLLGRRN
ncbi:hypothetical protein AO269_29910 [Pseudomonas putida]|nr:hypothetical protein AO269_29910 [Pseudomonas putida]